MPSTGYGRGYYGEGQLAPQPPQARRGGGWIKLGLVVGVGAVIWYMWPRKPSPDYDTSGGGGGGPRPGSPAPAPMSPLGAWHPAQVNSLAQPSQGGDRDGQSRGYVAQQAYEDAQSSGYLPQQQTYLSQQTYLPQQTYPPQQTYEDAQSRGYASQQAYEDAMVASARQLQDTGARVTLAPHFQHLTPRLGP